VVQIIYGNLMSLFKSDLRIMEEGPGGLPTIISNIEIKMPIDKQINLIKN